jgi:hypothetical protein
LKFPSFIPAGLQTNYAETGREKDVPWVVAHPFVIIKHLHGFPYLMIIASHGVPTCGVIRGTHMGPHMRQVN